MSAAAPTKRRASEAYLAKLRDPRWQKKRLEILSRDEWTCRICGDSESTLHVHHRRYMRGREPWDIDNESLVTLCETCHETESEFLRESLDCLEEQARIKLFAYQIDDLAAGLNALRSKHPCVAEIIAHVMRDEDAFEAAHDHYFSHLQSQRRDKKADVD